LIALAISRDIIQLLKLSENETTQPKVIGNLESPEGSPLEILKFSPDGRHLAAVTRNRTIQLWNLARIGDQLVKLTLDIDWPEHLSGAKTNSHPQLP
jgi:WD40 repeat protein